MDGPSSQARSLERNKASNWEPTLAFNPAECPARCVAAQSCRVGVGAFQTVRLSDGKMKAVHANERKMGRKALPSSDHCIRVSVRDRQLDMPHCEQPYGGLLFGWGKLRVHIYLI